MTEQETLELIKKTAEVFKTAGASEVYLFGSATGAKMRSDSDIDLAVKGLPPQHFFKTMSKAQEILQRPLDVVDLDEDTPFVHYLFRKGKMRRVA